MLSELHNHLSSTKLLPPRSKLLLAVSGGVDSVSLLDLLHGLNTYYNWELAIAHLDHKTRLDSVDDAQLVGKLADDYGYKFYLGQLPGEERREAQLREARYGFLQELASAGGYDYIVTAHHGDDRLETSLLNSIRGADREGLAALRARRDNLVRPLLPFRKADIIVYANLHNLSYRQDSSNSDLAYRRNLLRNELMPLGSITQADFRSQLSCSLDRLEVLNDRIESNLQGLLADIVIEQNGKKVEIDQVRFSKLPEAVQLNLLSYICKQLAPGVALSQKNLEQALRFVSRARSGSVTHLASGLHMMCNYGSVMITSVNPVSNPRSGRTAPLNVNQPFSHGLFNLRLLNEPIDTDRPQALVRPGNMYVRFWQPGDRVQPLGMEGSKKLQDVFSDAKVPKHLRSHWPVVVSASGEVVWLPTLAIDRRFAATDKDQPIQLICEV
ncbi:tRNA lysidine(34) synthetase TilS [Candidatus Saccharibacteria bacterium]|nr:tRNA lysidine(34) synthetase TilS [Candidatus Saccharibacteria bacterium]